MTDLPHTDLILEKLRGLVAAADMHQRVMVSVHVGTLRRAIQVIGWQRDENEEMREQGAVAMAEMRRLIAQDKELLGENVQVRFELERMTGVAQEGQKLLEEGAQGWGEAMADLRRLTAENERLRVELAGE